MTKFDKLVAEAKNAQRNNVNAGLIPYGSAVSGEFKVSVSPVQGRVSHLDTVKIACYINNKVVSKAKMQEAMR